MEKNMQKRTGFIGILIEDRKANAPAVNEILTLHGGLIRARMGVHGDDECAVISLTVEATADELGALTGKLGRLPGVSVKSMFAKGAA